MACYRMILDRGKELVDPEKIKIYDAVSEVKDHFTWRGDSVKHPEKNQKLYILPSDTNPYAYKLLTPEEFQTYLAQQYRI